MENYTKMRALVFGLSEKDFETFIRQRLGQKDAALRLPGQPHLRLCFHTDTPGDVVNNMQILDLFSDLFNWGDHNHPPLITGYKGSLCVTGYDRNEFGGWGTVDVLKSILKRLPEHGYGNGMSQFAE